jgi:hypothetical protein
MLYADGEWTYRPHRGQALLPLDIRLLFTSDMPAGAGLLAMVLSRTPSPASRFLQRSRSTQRKMNPEGRPAQR